MVHEHPAHIREHAFPKKADQQKFHSFRKVFLSEFPLLFQLGEKFAGTLDGTRDELGKKRNEQREIAEVFLRLEIPAIDVDDIRQRLKRIKRDSDGQENIQGNIVYLSAEQPNHARQVLQQEIDVFEKDQNAQTKDDRYRKPQLLDLLFLRSGNQKRTEIRHQTRHEHEKTQPDVPAHIEKVRRGEKHYPTETMRKNPIQKDRYR